MNKQTKIQFIKLFEATSDFLDVEETPQFDEVDFMPIASDRHTHTEAVLALANDIADDCGTPETPEEISSPAPEPAIN